MKITTITQDQILHILETARLAPSAHNAQSWKATVEANTIVVSVDARHTLKEGDPTGRQTILGLGIFSEACSIGAEHIGFKVQSVNFTAKDRVAKIVLEKSQSDLTSQKNGTLAISAVKSRCTDRSIYKPAIITKEFIHTLEKMSNKDTKVTVLTDKAHLDAIAELSSKGMSMAISSPSFRKELTEFFILPWSKKDRGISVNSFYMPKLLSYCQKGFMKFNAFRKIGISEEKKKWESASAAVVVSTTGDMPNDWFEAGRLYFVTCIAIEKSGLSQATSAAIVEASNFHEDIEKLAGISGRVQSTTRIGKGSAKRYYSPRVQAQDLLH